MAAIIDVKYYNSFMMKKVERSREQATSAATERSREKAEKMERERLKRKVREEALARRREG